MLDGLLMVLVQLLGFALLEVVFGVFAVVDGAGAAGVEAEFARLGACFELGPHVISN